MMAVQSQVYLFLIYYTVTAQEDALGPVSFVCPLEYDIIEDGINKHLKTITYYNEDGTVLIHRQRDPNPYELTYPVELWPKTLTSVFKCVGLYDGNARVVVEQSMLLVLDYPKLNCKTTSTITLWDGVTGDETFVGMCTFTTKYSKFNSCYYKNESSPMKYILKDIWSNGSLALYQRLDSCPVNFEENNVLDLICIFKANNEQAKAIFTANLPIQTYIPVLQAELVYDNNTDTVLCIPGCTNPLASCNITISNGQGYFHIKRSCTTSLMYSPYDALYITCTVSNNIGIVKKNLAIVKVLPAYSYYGWLSDIAMLFLFSMTLKYIFPF